MFIGIFVKCLEARRGIRCKKFTYMLKQYYDGFEKPAEIDISRLLLFL